MQNNIGLHSTREYYTFENFEQTHTTLWVLQISDNASL